MTDEKKEGRGMPLPECKHGGRNVLGCSICDPIPDFTIDGPPYREPTALPAVGTAPLQFLRERAHFDPVAAACGQMRRHGASVDTALLAALHTYANALDDARRQLDWYMQRYTVTIKVSK